MPEKRLPLALALFCIVGTGCADSPTLPQADPAAPSSPLEDPQAGPIQILSGSGPIHLWSGEGDASDAVGGANGVLGSTTTFGAGLVGKAFSFDGRQTSIVTLPLDIGPASLPEITVGMFVKLRSVANDRGWVLGHDDGVYDRSLALTDTRYQSGVAGGTGTYPHFSSLIKLGEHLDEWHCVAVAYDAALWSAMFYADGSTQTTWAHPGGGLPTASLGGQVFHWNHTVDALVDEVFVYDRVLTKEELDAVCAGEPPVLGFVLEPTTLWPVNHKMVTVARGISARDSGGAALTPTVTVTSNEAAGAPGAGHTEDDWAVILNDDGTVDVQVRAERSGSRERVYTITATATDASGRTTEERGTVTVAHDMGKGKSK